jgi:thiol:disulfide interchange protein DsbC
MFFGIASAQTPEDLFKKDFPKISYQSFKPSNIPGLYEVSVEDRILYYSPAAYSIIFGEIIFKDGKNLTQERETEIMVSKIKDIPLEKALKIGNGKNTVIEFTDPDCPFCRKGSKFLSTRADTTRYIFFVPLPSHPDSAPKVRYILCAQDKEKAYADAMSGKLDNMKFKLCTDPKVDEMVKAQEEIGQRIGISATPTYFINGVPIRGADIQAITKLLPQAQK